MLCHWGRRSDCSLVYLQSHTYNRLFRCVTFTELTILHANILFPHGLHNTLQIKPSHFVTDSANSLLKTVSCRELPVCVSCRELFCSADGLQDNPSAQIPRKKGRSIVECLFTGLLHSNDHGTDHRKPVTNSHSAISLALAYCCLATSNNIRNSIVECVYSVAKSVA
jgi:hypothetical protein